MQKVEMQVSDEVTLVDDVYKRTFAQDLLSW